MAVLEIVWTAPALTDVAETIDLIASSDSDAAHRWYDGIIHALERAAAFPYAGRTVPELSRDDVREVIVGQYRAMYRVSETHLVVWAVRQGRRLISEDVVADQPDDVG